MMDILLKIYKKLEGKFSITNSEKINNIGIKEQITLPHGRYRYKINKRKGIGDNIINISLLNKILFLNSIFLKNKIIENNINIEKKGIRINGEKNKVSIKLKNLIKYFCNKLEEEK